MSCQNLDRLVTKPLIVPKELVPSENVFASQTFLKQSPQCADGVPLKKTYTLHDNREHLPAPRR